MEEAAEPQPPCSKMWRKVFPIIVFFFFFGSNACNFIIRSGSTIERAYQVTNPLGRITNHGQCKKGNTKGLFGTA
jgi:hypothetical protein